MINLSVEPIEKLAGEISTEALGEIPPCGVDTVMVASATSAEPLAPDSAILDGQDQPSRAGETKKKGTAEVVREILSESHSISNWSLHMDTVDPITKQGTRTSPVIRGAGHFFQDDSSTVEGKKGSGSWFYPMGETRSPSTKRKSSVPDTSPDEVFPSLRTNLKAAAKKTRRRNESK
jgi:hypothetical protein